MDTPTHQARPRARHWYRLAGAGLAVAAFGADRPVLGQSAARLGPARLAEAAPPVTRGGYPDEPPPAGFAPARAWPQHDTLGERAARLFGAGGSAAPVSEVPTAPVSFGELPADPAGQPSEVGRAWAGLKNAVFPPSAGGPLVFDDANRGFPAFDAMPPAVTGSGVPTPPAPTTYASPPAYRWYGWGTTTPGTNPYAPTGKSPAGSSGWITQTRATPGAFPVPAVAKDTAPPTGSPAYAGAGKIPDSLPPVRVATRFDTPARPEPTAPPALPAPNPATYVRSPAPVMAPPPAPTLAPPPAGPTPIAVSHSAPGVASGPTSQPASGDGLVWRAVSQPAAAPTSARPRVEIVPTREPAALPASVLMSTQHLQGIVRNQCASWVKDVQVTTPESGKVVVEFAAYSESHAHAAAEAVSRVPALRGYEVSFVARIAKP